MEIFLYIASFLLIRRLLSSTKFTPLGPKWKLVLNTASIGVWVVYAVAEDQFEDTYNLFLGAFVLLGIVYYFLNQEDFKPMHSFIKVHYPLAAITIVVALIDLIAPKFGGRYNNWTGTAILLGFAWIFARWANSRKQEQEMRMVSMQNLELDRLVAERTAELTNQRNYATAAYSK
jgi:two-component system NtrC family sensor kinase